MTAKQRLIGLLNYVEQLARLSEGAVFSVRRYHRLMFFEHQLLGRIGIQHNVADEEGAVWLVIQRLQRRPPPLPAEDIRKWLTIPDDPARVPVARETILEMMSRQAAEELVSKGVVDGPDVMDSPRGDADTVDVRLRIDRQPNLRQRIEAYSSGPWANWSEEEQPRRETIEIYDGFFSVVQAIETEGADNPTEVVLGVGMALWKTEGKTIEHPLVEALVEIEIDATTHAIRVRARETDPQVYLKPFSELDNRAVPELKRTAQAHFDRMARATETADEPAPVEFSPFHRPSFEPILRTAVGLLSSEAGYYPDIADDPADRSLPEITEQLVITDTWAVYVRPRSGNLFVQDIDRLRQELNGSDEMGLPAPGKRLVTPPEDELLQQAGPNLQLGIGVEDAGFRNAAPDAPVLSDRDVLFPKAYNQAQIEIIRRLQSEDGVVVQGPPGTGKTHTIANIICHYLATGRNVLVVSKGEPALEVLQNQIPEEVRNLTISLLTNERQGLRQLEAAVTFMANRVVNQDPLQIDRQRLECEGAIVALRQEIDEMDGKVRQWADRQWATVPEGLYSGSNQSPAALALEVLAHRGQHEWLEDSPGWGDQHVPRFTDVDITAIRNARRKLGLDLAHLGCALPSPMRLPDSLAICSIHQDLMRAEETDRAAKAQGIPLMAATCENPLPRAERLLQDMQGLCDYLTQTAPQCPWLKGLYEKWLRAGGDTEQTRLIDDLTSEMGRLAKLRQSYLERPVRLPKLVGPREALVEAVTRAERGKRPFRFLSLGNGAIQDCFNGIQVEGRRPAARSDWEHVLNFLSYQDKLSAVVSRWNAMARDFGLPPASADFTAVDRWLVDTYNTLRRARDAAVAYQERIRPTITLLFSHGIGIESLACNPDIAKQTVTILETNISRQRLLSARDGLDGAIRHLESCGGRITQDLLSFLGDSVGNPQENTDRIRTGWQGLVQELHRVSELRRDMDTVNRVADLVESSGAPLWAQKLRTAPAIGATDPWTPGNWEQSWRFRRLQSYLHSIDGREQLREVAKRRAEADRRLLRATTEAVRLRTYLGLHRRMTPARRSALQQFLAAIRHIGAGTGIRARRYRRDARQAMQRCMDSVPCWIMPTWRVSESLPAKLGTFDLVIVDEASQSDAMALPTLLRARKVLVVGDDRQVSPSPAFILERKLLQLRHSYLQDQPFADMLMPGMSLYDLAQAVFPGGRTLLNEHFRCVEPIIRFSLQFYPEEIIPLRIPKSSERLDPPLVDVYVSNGARDDQKINRAEAVAIVDEIARLTADPAYRDRTLGVVSLIGNKQAHYIQKLLLERIGEDAFLRHKITCGDPPTFQGKERDVMFLSMVASPGRAHALISRLFEQRFNVALSRARDRMYLFRSVEPNDLSNERDLKLRVINHFLNPMPVPQAEAAELIERCESEFERNVFRRLVKLGFRVTPQVAVGQFRIDLVVDGEDDRRLAVELDGDRYHGPERWLEDWSRQKILERAGWRFWRCWASSFAVHPDSCMNELMAKLKEMGIEPIGHDDGHHPYTEQRTVTPQLQDTSVARAAESGVLEDTVQVGDRVIVSFDGDASRHLGLTISDHEDDLVNGIISWDSPAGQALRGAAVEDEVDLPWNSETRRATVLQIDKAPTSTTQGNSATVGSTVGNPRTKTEPSPQPLAPPSPTGTAPPLGPPTDSPAAAGITLRSATPAPTAPRTIVTPEEKHAVLRALNEAGRLLVTWQVVEKCPRISQERMEEILPILVCQGDVKRIEGADAVRYSRV